MINVDATRMNIKRLRSEKDISVIKLADALSLSVQAVYKWERGEAIPTVDNLVVLSDMFNVSINDILVCYERKVG